jgi:hypothetical protein
MAYLFVFDYYEDESLNDMLEVYYSIATDESIKSSEEAFTTVKVFVCNKYPLMIEEPSTLVPYSEIVKSYMQKDKRTMEIINKIQKRLVVNKQTGNNKSRLEAKEMIFFTSAQNNLGIRNCFDMIFNKIKHKEDLWKKTTYENIQKRGPNGEEIESEEDKDETEHLNDSSEGVGFFCCKKPNQKKIKTRIKKY